MDSELLYQPDKRETLDLFVQNEEHFEITFYEWRSIISEFSDGSLNYSTWFQDDDELTVLHHSYYIMGGEVVSYQQETDV